LTLFKLVLFGKVSIEPTLSQNFLIIHLPVVALGVYELSRAP